MGSFEFMAIPAVTYILNRSVFGTVKIIPDATAASAVETVRALAFSLFRLLQSPQLSTNHPITYLHDLITFHSFVNFGLSACFACEQFLAIQLSSPIATALDVCEIDNGFTVAHDLL